MTRSWKFNISLFFFFTLFVSANSLFGQVTAQDGKTYKTIKIGNQVWMAENLNVSTYRNGDSIPQVQDAAVWSNLKTGAWCYYEGKKNNGTVYGKLYNWYAIIDPRGLAPAGWHISTDADWNQLAAALGGRVSVSPKIKAAMGWSNSGNGSDETGFSALPGGTRSIALFSFAGNYGYWWTASEFDSYSAWNRFLSYNNNDIGRSTGWKQFGNSIRCVKGEGFGFASTASNDNKSDTGQLLASGTLPVAVNEAENLPSYSIGYQTWAKQNLDVVRFKNGDTIPEVRTDAEWQNATKLKKPAWCYYNNDSSLASRYGKLYNWYAVTDKRGLAPTGWHVPDSTEWSTFVNLLGEKVAGAKIKSKSGWLYKNDDSIETGFAGVPAGFRNIDGEFSSARVGGYWWSTNGSSQETEARYYNITYFSDAINSDSGAKGKGYSVRCVKD